MERRGSMLARGGAGPGRFERQWRVERGGAGWAGLLPATGRARRGWAVELGAEVERSAGRWSVDRRRPSSAAHGSSSAVRGRSNAARTVERGSGGRAGGRSSRARGAGGARRLSIRFFPGLRRQAHELRSLCIVDADAGARFDSQLTLPIVLEPLLVLTSSAPPNMRSKGPPTVRGACVVCAAPTRKAGRWMLAKRSSCRSAMLPRAPDGWPNRSLSASRCSPSWRTRNGAAGAASPRQRSRPACGRFIASGSMAEPSPHFFSFSSPSPISA